MQEKRMFWGGGGETDIETGRKCLPQLWFPLARREKFHTWAGLSAARQNIQKYSDMPRACISRSASSFTFTFETASRRSRPDRLSETEPAKCTSECCSETDGHLRLRKESKMGPFFLSFWDTREVFLTTTAAASPRQLSTEASPGFFHWAIHY